MMTQADTQGKLMSYRNGDTRPTGKRCEICGKPLEEHYINMLGWVKSQCECVVERRRKEREAEKAAKKERNRRSRHMYSRMPQEQQESTFESWNPREGLESRFEACTRYADKFEEMKAQGKGILLVGSTGSGKTHLACAIGNRLIDRGYRVRFQPMSDLFFRIRASMNGGRETEDEIVRPLITCDLLILDDLGEEKKSEYTESILQYILTTRNSSRNPTIITTNLGSKELYNHVGARTYDRISASCPVIKLAAESYRRKGGAK